MATLTSRLIVALTDRASRPARGIGAALDSLHRRAARTSGALLGTGGVFAGGAVRSMMAVGAGYLGVTRGIGGTVGAALKFEEAFSDVKKVLNGTPAQLAEVRHEILEMSKRLPNSAEGISAIFAAAAQSNIPLKEIGKFSEMVAKVAVAWDVTEGETSDALAKIKNQLSMNVSEIGLYSDAINHLSNNTAAAAPDLVDFSKRVAAQGEMFGFSATETLAFGATMVAMGAQTEVASTSFRNMGMALADAANAPKRARTAFKALGIDATKVAKAFKTDAAGTMLDVFERIKELPEHERLSAAIGVFGREARALMPLINDSRELRRQLGLVASETNYAGSAVQEFEEKASTTGNALRLLGNRVRAIGIGIGDGWLPTIKAAADGIGDVLLTLGQRVGVLDTIQTSFSAFIAGLGGKGGKDGVGGVRQLMNDLGDALFGEAFEAKVPGEADPRVVALAKTSNMFRSIGRDLRAFVTDVGAGNVAGAMSSIGSALSDMSGGMTVGGAIAIGLTGRALLGLAAGAVALTFSKAGQVAIMAMAVATLINAVKEASSLGEFVDNLGELSTFDWAVVAGGVGLLAGQVFRLSRGATRLGRSVGGWFGKGKNTPATSTTSSAGGAPAGGPQTRGRRGGNARPWGEPRPVARGGPTGPHMPEMSYRAPTIWQGIKGTVGRGLFTAAATYIGETLIEMGLEAANSKLFTPEQRQNADERLKNEGIWSKEFWLGKAADPDFDFRDHMKIDAGIGGSGPAEVDVASPVETRPGGTQDVRVTNPMPAPNITVNITATQDAQAIAAAAVAAISERWNALSRGAYSDGAN